METEVLNSLTQKTELCEAEAMYDMYSAISNDLKKDLGIKNERYKGAVILSCESINTVLFNRVIGLNIFEKITPHEVNYIYNFYEKIQKYAVQLCPLYIDNNLSNELISNKFLDYSYWNRLYRKTGSKVDHNTELKVKEVKLNEAAAYAEIITSTFDFPEPSGEFFKAIVERKNWYNYFAVYQGKKIAAASMYIYKDTAWMGLAATLPQFRGKGAQNLLINHRNNTAARHECKLLSVETSPEISNEGRKNPSFYNLLKHGFEKIYERRNFIKGIEEV